MPKKKLTKSELRVLEALRRGKKKGRTSMKPSLISLYTSGRTKRKLSIPQVNSALGKLISKGKVERTLTYEAGGYINGKRFRGRAYKIKKS